MVMKKIKSKPKSKRKLSPSKPQKEGYHLPIRTEEEQLEGLSEDLLDAWHRFRAFLVSLGEQDIHTSHRSIMFARKTCYTFVRPKKSALEVNFFLPQALDSELLKKVTAVSKKKFVHVLQLIHSDQVERPLTKWIEEAYRHSG